jgi:AcrR family transcriptional regulator
MQVKPTGGERGRSLTAVARRAQIIDATIETIAERGYGRTSFARIAERVGLSSTRLISYHFAGKQELMEQVADKIIADIDSFVTGRLAGQTTASGALRGYLEANLQYIAGHRAEMRALFGIFLSGALRTDDAESAGDPVAAVTGVPPVSPVGQILRDGQLAGEFRQFDTVLVATSIQRTIEGIPLLLESRPDLDLEACARELVTLYDLAVRSGA